MGRPVSWGDVAPFGAQWSARVDREAGAEARAVAAAAEAADTLPDRPSFAEQAGQAPQPCPARTRWATAICCERLARSARDA